MRNQARCGCSWRGKRRWILVNAILDASNHSQASGHHLAGVSEPRPEFTRRSE
jgi:hypothetical protein